MLYTADRQILRFDADGNIIRFSAKDRPQDLRYDSQNRLIRGNKVRYAYDSEGTRIEQQGRRSKTTYVTDVLHANLLIAQDKKKQGIFYLYGNGLLAQEDRSGTAYYHYDAQGNTRLLRSEKGERLASFCYDPHGNLLSHTGQDTPFRYSGKYGVQTDESGLLYMRSRYYSPDLCRFLSADSYMGDLYHPASLNPYSYVEGNPVRYIDPIGYWATEFATYQEKRPIPTIPKKPPLSKKKSVQRPPSLLSQSLYDISVDCADGTDPFRQSVRYQIFSRQAEKLGLYGADREEYIRFLRIVYGSLEYGRTDGLSGRSYTDAERREMYGFDESPGRLSEKILYQQGYEMRRAEREAWGMIAAISIMKELQATNPKEGPEVSSFEPQKLPRNSNIDSSIDTGETIFKDSRFPEDPNELFPEDYIGMTKEMKSNGKITYTVEAGGEIYKIEYHPTHNGNGHYDGNHYHVKKLSKIPKPNKMNHVYFRIPNLDSETPTIPGGGTFAPRDKLPTQNKH